MLLAVLSETSALNDCTGAIVLSPERYKSQSRKLGFDHRLLLEWELCKLVARACLWQDGIRISDEMMPNISQLPAIAASSMAVRPPETPFRLETIRRTVLKLVNPLASQQPSVPASEEVLAAMQRLMAIINTLQLSQPVFLEGLSFQAPRTLETLLPYVSEEAYDVMDVLQSQRLAVSGQRSAVSINSKLKTQNSKLKTLADPPLPSFITIDALIPALLWQIARSDYSLMHLIEGVRGRCWQPQGWATGMVRLVVMLELEAPASNWCFDLATGHPAKGLLESIAIVQTDEPTLPVQQTVRAANDVIDASCQVGHQLQAILQQLQFETFGLGSFLQGMAVERLQPGSDWQTGELRLRFGFEFTAQASDPDGCEESQQSELIEAELMEEGVAIAHATTQVSVLKTFGRSLSPATLVRVSKAELLERYTQQTTRQQMAQSLCQSQHWSSNHDEGEQLAMIVQAALNTLTHHVHSTGIGLLQPTLLLDELAPKLLWSLTRCTYEMMQLLGGLPAQVLQPGANWQQGTLQLLAVLHITAPNQDYTLDLSTGRSAPVNAAALAEGAIVQSRATALCQQPTPIETLTAHLHKRWADAPEYELLTDGLAVEWLEDVDQDWQTGTMTLKLSLGFYPDAA